MLTATHPTSVADLKANLGEELGVNGWHDVTQAKSDPLAEATADRQWIHTNPERARTTPFGGTIAHGYYTLSLAPALFAQGLSLDGFAMGVNYRPGQLRLPEPKPLGKRVRRDVRIDSVDDIQGGASLTVTLTFECEGSEKPVCTALALY